MYCCESQRGLRDNFFFGSVPILYVVCMLAFASQQFARCLSDFVLLFVVCVICTCVITTQFARLDEARRELGALLEEEVLRRLPLLVVANKIDLDPHVSRDELIKGCFRCLRCPSVLIVLCPPQR